MSKLILIFGELQKGKSTLAAHESKRLHRAQLFFDPGETFEHGLVCHDADAFTGAIEDDQEPPIIFRSNEPDRDIADFVHTVLRYRDCSIVVDEASFLMSPHYMDPALSRLIRRGPKQNKNRDLIFTQHRVIDCHGTALFLAHECVFFRSDYEKDFQRIAEYCSLKAAERVRTLGEHDFLWFDRIHKTFYVNDKPESWRVELTPALPAALEDPDRELVFRR